MVELATVFNKLQIAGHTRACEPSVDELKMVEPAERYSIGGEEYNCGSKKIKDSWCRVVVNVLKFQSGVALATNSFVG